MPALDGRMIRCNLYSMIAIGRGVFGQVPASYRG
jgi:hypothetical protein